MWWVTEPHCLLILVFEKLLVDVTAFGIMAFDEMSSQCSIGWHFDVWHFVNRRINWGPINGKKLQMCMKILLVRIRSSLSVTIIFKRTKDYKYL
jgi:hypothetical protein